MKKSLDCKGRWRNKTVACHASESEAELIDVLAMLSGLTKQDYIIRRLLCKDIVVQGNPRVYKALRNKMEDIYEELKRIEKSGDISDEFLDTLQQVAKTLNGLKEEME